MRHTTKNEHTFTLNEMSNMPQEFQPRIKKTNPELPASTSTIPFSKVYVKVSAALSPLNTVFGSTRSVVTCSSSLETRTRRSRTVPTNQFSISTVYKSGGQTPQDFQQFNKLEHSVNTIVFPHRLLRIANLEPFRLSIPSGSDIVSIIIARNSTIPSHVQVSVEPKRHTHKNSEIRSPSGATSTGPSVSTGVHDIEPRKAFGCDIMNNKTVQTKTLQSCIGFLCNNCGIYSSHPETCNRCGKKIKIPPICKDPQMLNITGGSMKPRSKMEDVVLLASDDEPESRKMRNRVQECKNSPGAYPGLQVHVKSQVNGSDATTSSAKVPDPEEVITEIELLISGGHNLKTAFTTLSCRCVSIGSYRVTSTGPHELGLGPDLRLTFSEVGILFHLPHCETRNIQKCAVASHQILTVYVNFHDASAVFVIVTGPKFATWMRQRLGMNHDSSAELFYCPLNGDETQKHLTFMVTSLSEIDASIIRRIYGRNLVEWDVALCKVFLKKICLEPMEDYSSQSSLIKPSINNKSRVECTAEEFQTTNGEVHKLFQYPEAGLKESIVVHSSDVACLAEEQFLNDQIIDFYLRYFLDSLSDEERNRSYVYNTFFYKRLTTRPKRKSSAPWEFDPALSVAQKRHARVKSWTKRIDIFEKDYLFVPINESAHWFLAVICFPGLLCPALFRDDTSLPWLKNARKKSRRSTRTTRNDLGEPNGASADGDQLNASSYSVQLKNTTNFKQRIKQPCILLFDSLAGGTRSRVYSTLREYLRVEYKVRKGEDRYFDKRVMPGYQPRVPQQPNNCDCGVYSIQYAESFFTSPIQSFYFPLCSLLNWFPESSMHSKRKEIYDIIINLINTKYPENASFVPKLNFLVDDPGWNSSDEHASDSAEVPMDVDESSKGESALTKKHGLTSQVLCTPPLNTLTVFPSPGIRDIRFSNDKKGDIVPPGSKKTKLK